MCTAKEITDTLKDMISDKIEGLGYKQLYLKTSTTEALRVAFGFDLDKKFISNKTMKKF